MESRERLESHGPTFRIAGATHVAVFGTSKILSGFIPSLFDSLVSDSRSKVESYNFGLPGVSRFLPDLERLVASGQTPQIVLLTEPWPADDDRPTIFKFLSQDDQIMRTLFPFRRMIRDYTLFALTAASRGGLAAYYNQNRSSLEQVDKDRGYYFIARESHYADNRLPDDFRLDSDQPDVQEKREASTGVYGFSKLYSILTQNHIHCLFVSGYVRIGEMSAANPTNEVLIEALKPYPLIQVLGPDYLRYPNRLFSDPLHANPEGARAYTHDIAVLVKSWLEHLP